MRKKFSPELKAKVALAAIKGDLTVAEISSRFEVHSNRVGRWKKKAISELSDIFANGTKKTTHSNDQLLDELYKQIGKLRVENEWLKKKSEIFAD